MANVSGWVPIHRKIIDSAIYTDSQAVHLWLHLLLKANHEPKTFFMNGNAVTVNTGQLLTGRKVISAETGIKEWKIQRLLESFEKCHMIAQQTTNKNRLISILNYTDYQSLNNKCTTDQQQINNRSTQTITNNNYNNKKKGGKRFKPPTVNEVEEYLKSKSIICVDAETFVDFYTSKGWMIGKNKMKSWKHAITTWVKRGQNNETHQQARKGTRTQQNLDAFDRATADAYET